MNPKLLLVIALIVSLMLAMPAWADGAADGGEIEFKMYNGKPYSLTAPPAGADLTQARPSVDQLRKYYASCYRNGASFGTPTSMMLRPGQNTLWQGWYCPSTKPSLTPGSDTNPTPSPQPNPQPNPNNPKGCGSMVNGKWVEVPCDFDKKPNPVQPSDPTKPTPPDDPKIPTVPTVPTPTVPSNLDPELLKQLRQALEALSKAYQSKFNSLRDEAIGIKKRLANNLNDCVRMYQGKVYTECAESAIKSAQKKLEEVQKEIDITQAQMQKDFAELAKQIASVPNVSGISINIPSGSSSGSISINGGGNGDGSNGNGGGDGTGGSGGGGNGGGGTTNIYNNVVNHNTTINNNGGSGGGSGGGTGIGGNGSQQGGKDYSNALKEINNSLNNIEKQLSKGSNDKGNNDKGNDGKGNDANDGKGDKGNPDGKPDGNPDGEDKGETLSEYCKNNPNALACVKLGDKEEIDKAIAESKGKDKDGRPFGMGEHEIGIPQISRSHDFVESGVCPAPKQVMILGAMQEFSYQPMCDFASKIRPVVIVSAILLAFFIVQASISKA
ncbi:attachment protein [Inovirus D_HF35_23]|nr:attachment protein [Inovirus D_HF35_23]